MAPKLTSAQAATRGHLFVNGCVGLTMLGLPGASYGVARLLGYDYDSAIMLAASAFLLSWPLSWLTWSVLVTRWRLWAYERVEDLDVLKQHAVAVGLVWREGHFFERTEIRSHDQQRRILALERAWAVKRTENEPNP